ncbi:hypothetical protein V7S43_005903 [Phytophthora oleae]|uniref:PiggyBac transposable element-derived protein domain-containing protein n=1 Tax=Phytophthora oleae TaxID=2107226 RepID=A0ABD3FS85_9STRA
MQPTSQFSKDKPHKWGTKVFVAACAKTAYCMSPYIGFGQQSKYTGAPKHTCAPP